MLTRDSTSTPRPGRKTALDTAIANDATPATFELLFARGAVPEAKHRSAIRAMMRTNGDAVLPLFEERLAQ